MSEEMIAKMIGEVPVFAILLYAWLQERRDKLKAEERLYFHLSKEKEKPLRQEP